ncbi:MAG TPA: phytanoyl-CoA dioxygenase family protein [Ramlibacter sp.]|nr:phytanoyl-CoA dioxygenase family protein [Ramlibacter sp.]
MQIATPRFMDPGFAQSEAFAAASPQEQAFAVAMARDGFAVIDPGIADFGEVAATVIRETTTMLPGAGRLQDAWRRIEAVRQVAVAPQVLKLLEFGYGRRPLPFQTLNFTVGTQQLTHSDTVHFDSFPKHFMCGVWIAYEDTDLGNGALHYVPGSHRLPIMALEDFGLSAGSYFNRNDVGRRYERALSDYIARQGLEKRPVPLRKGQALVWAANLFHGGEPITDKGRTRYSQVTHCFFDDCLYMQPLWSDLHGGRIMYKKVYDIAQKRYVPPRYNGAQFRLPLAAHLRELLVAKVIGVRRS